MHITILVPGYGMLSAIIGPLEVFSNTGEAGREKMRREFSLERMVAGNLAVYRELLDDMPKHDEC